jgi:hypothetical protein
MNVGNTLETDMVDRLTALEAENAKLRQLASDLVAANLALEVKLGKKPSAERGRKVARVLRVAPVPSPSPQGQQLTPA